MNEIIKNHAVINVRKIHIENRFGRYWNSTRFCVPALTDLRARQGKFSTPWNTQPDPLFTPPAFNFINDKLSDIFDDRAIELNNIAKAENKTIYIMWSGGIDSTAVVSSFIKNIPEQDLANFVIVLTADSVEENPVFFEKFIFNKIKCISYLEYTLNNHELERSISLNGDPADCLFGPSIWMFKHLVPDGSYHKPFKDNLKMIIEPLEKSSMQYIKKFLIPGFGTWYVHKITKNLVDVAPPGVETISDWWWWHYYNFKWQYSVWRPFLRRKAQGYESEPLTANNIKSFVENTYFNTDRFQQWSYSNRRNHIVNNDISTHKQEVKKYILELDGNESYYLHKTKIQSVPVYDHSLFFDVRKPFLWGGDWVGYHDNEHPELVAECKQLLESYKG